MVGLELVAALLRSPGPLEHAITHAQRIQNHIKSIEQNDIVVQQFFTSLIRIRTDLQQVHSQFENNVQSISKLNTTILHTQLMKISNTLNDIEASLSFMDQSDANFKQFHQSIEWSAKCQHIERRLENAQSILLDITSILDNNTTHLSSLEQTESQIHPDNKDTFKTMNSFENLLSPAIIVPDFSSTDTDGNPSTVEGKLRLELLNSTRNYDRIFTIQGPNGVGKTTILQLLSRDREIQDHYSNGVHCVKLGPDRKIVTVIKQIANAVRRSGGANQAEKVEMCCSIADAMSLVSEWFIGKRFLLLVDDVREHKQLGSTFLMLLRDMIAISDNAAMIFTTRDPVIANIGKVFKLDCRESQGPESRMILFRHARQDYRSRLNDASEKAITNLLDICEGLPVAHSIVGKSVWQYSMTRNEGAEDAWIEYSQRQSNTPDVIADEYDSLSSLFSTTLHVLDEDPSDNVQVTQPNLPYSYQEMHQALCVFEKRQWVPLEVLGDLWNIKSEERVRSVCQNFVRVGLAEWYDEEGREDQFAEGILMHDLAHEFATKQAEKDSKVSLWHQLLLERHANRTELKYSSLHRCREWWKSSDHCNRKDSGYFSRNFCRHLAHGMPLSNEVLMLVIRPQWIGMQVSQNGLLQYERDLSFARQYLERNDIDISHKLQVQLPYGEMGIEELEMIHHAVRLSVSFLMKNPNEIWFQLYGRLLRTSSVSTKIKMYLEDMKKNSSKPWAQSMETMDDLLTDVESGLVSLVNVGTSLTCMEMLPGELEVICGCKSGKLVIVNVEECVPKKQWSAHNSDIADIAIDRSSKTAVSVSNDGVGKIWEVASWHELGSFQTYFDRFEHVRFGNNERYVYTTTKARAIQIWNLDSKQCIWRTFSRIGQLNTIAILNDDERILTNCNEKKLLEWKNSASDKNQSQQATVWIEPPKEIDHRKISMIDYVSCIETSDKLPRMAIGYKNGSVQLWNTNEMTSIGTPFRVYDDSVDCIALSTDCNKLACTSNENGIAVREVATGEMICNPYHGHTDSITGIKYIEKVDGFVSCSHDGTVRVLKMNKVVSKESAADTPVKKYIFVRLSTDESRFISKGEDRSIAVWDAATGQLIGESDRSGKYIDAIAAMNGKLFITIESNGVISMNNVDNPNSTRPLNSAKTPVNCVDIAWSCKFVVGGSFDKTIRIWDLNDSDESHETIHTDDEILRVLVSSDEERIISASDDCVEVRNIETKCCLKRVMCWDTYYEPRDKIMHFVGEEEMKEIDTGYPVVRIHQGNQVVWGVGSNSKVLATLESPVCQSTYSPLHKMLCVVTRKYRIRFLKIN